jgi:hypothetical protein
MLKSIFTLPFLACIFTFTATAQSSIDNLLGIYGCATADRFAYYQASGTDLPSENRAGAVFGIIYQRRIYKGIFLETGIWDASKTYDINNKNAFEGSASMINPALRQNLIFDYKKTYNILQLPLLAEYYFEFKRCAIGLSLGLVGNQILEMQEYNNNLQRPDILREHENWFFIGYKSQLAFRYSFTRHWEAELQLGASASHNKGFIENRLANEAGLAVMYAL